MASWRLRGSPAGTSASTVPAGNPVTFREIPASESKINWVHDNAKSTQRYLPETEPPGVAIFDYNNDGRMDILLVNSGESDFFPPRQAVEARALQKQWGRDLHERYGAGRHYSQHFRHGNRHWRL